MITTAIIAFREFLEAFLIVGVFLGISQKLNLKKEKEITLAAGIGMLISLSLASFVYIFGGLAQTILTHENSELLESYLLIFSGLFIAYVVFSLHDTIRKGRGETLLRAHKKLQDNSFDTTVFLTIMFLVLREGCEVALFTGTTSLFTTFFENITGLFVGFISAAAIGILTCFAYIKFPIGKIYRATEYMIILLGASLVQNGITMALSQNFNIHLENIFQIPLSFLPDHETPIGHLIQSFMGIDREFSMPRLFIMLLYIAAIYTVFFQKSKLAKVTFTNTS